MMPLGCSSGHSWQLRTSTSLPQWSATATQGRGDCSSPPALACLGIAKYTQSKCTLSDAYNSAPTWADQKHCLEKLTNHKYTIFNYLTLARNKCCFLRNSCSPLLYITVRELNIGPSKMVSSVFSLNSKWLPSL